eukprot:scaffold35939_cov150-Skeletonema_dohrnii-CCMP3373.AAC.2
MSPQKSKGGEDLEVVLEAEKATNGVDLNNAGATSIKTTYYTRQPKRSSFLKYPLTLSQRIREYRHNRCIMAPLAYTVIIALIVTAFVGLLLALPQFLLGILLAPLLRRQKWIVQFLYQNSIARWGHINIMKVAGKKNQGATKSEELPGHSQTINQRITVVPGRVYIHPIPQFIDNIAYLIVSCPPREAVGKLPVLGVLVDCGEDAIVKAHLEGIYKKYYACFYTQNKDIEGIELHAILCTHRHHDHTAGVGALVKELTMKRNGESKAKKPILVNAGRSGGDGQPKLYEENQGNVIVVGGAVEQVPYCNLYVQNGCFVPLPCLSMRDGDTTLENDMNATISIEVIGVPSHTRGSVVFALRSRPAPDIISSSAGGANVSHSQTHLFTGDAIFTGGAGAPFEADLERSRDNFLKNPKKLKSKNGNSLIRPQAGSLSTERCFAEVLLRASDQYPLESSSGSSTETTLLYPGHEYTTDLLMRQFDQKTITQDGHWVRMAPSTFFETASHYLTSAHRRALPQGQKLLTIPTPLDKEMIVNPNFRTLKRRAEHLVNALLLWYEFGAENRVPAENRSMFTPTTNKRRKDSIFTTVYSDDLNTILQDLRSGKIDPVSAADQIEALDSKLDENLIARRPIPSTLPSHKNVYLGILAMTVLGSAPAAVTLSDANIMNMAAPVESTDEILISKSRLISALRQFGLLSGGGSVHLEDIITLLWDESRLDNKSKEDDVESSIDNDLIELGLLKLSMFGVALNQPSWFSKYCVPCIQPKPDYDENSWVTTCKLKRTNGELQKHDPKTCLLCQGVVSSP